MKTKRFSHKKLQAIAEAKGIQQKAIAEKLETHPVSVNRWFTGDVVPSANAVPKLAAALGVDINDLYEEIDEPERTRAIA